MQCSRCISTHSSSCVPGQYFSSSPFYIYMYVLNSWNDLLATCCRFRWQAQQSGCRDKSWLVRRYVVVDMALLNNLSTTRGRTNFCFYTMIQSYVLAIVQLCCMSPHCEYLTLIKYFIYPEEFTVFDACLFCEKFFFITNLKYTG